ncbi:MAG: rhodanese-like domain-containing protein [Thermoplasmata archaeon]|nr:MAG: rhodanese-like domain-containing protein [Thermoplasmata archaeon]
MNLKFKVKALIGVVLISIVILQGCTTTEDDSPYSKTQTLLDITAIESYYLIQNNTENPNFIIIDIRTPEEYESGHLADSIIIDYYESTFEKDIDQLDKEKTYLIYCRTGRRTGLAMDIMEDLNFLNVYNMLGGITQWETEGLPII